MSIHGAIRELADQMGVDYFGVADLAPAHAFIREQGGDRIAEFPLAVSLGIGLLHPIVDQLPNRAERGVAIDYRHHGYDVVNLRLDRAASRIGSRLQRAGHRVLPVPASRILDQDKLCGSFPHKLGAHLAGLGWIGKSCLLVTPDNGPRVRWATVLTDAPLTVTGGPMEERCDTCEECVTACPVNAFTGRNFRADEPREMRYDASKCDRYFVKLIEKDPEVAVCGMCLYSCPYGKTAE